MLFYLLTPQRYELIVILPNNYPTFLKKYVLNFLTIEMKKKYFNKFGPLKKYLYLYNKKNNI